LKDSPRFLAIQGAAARYLVSTRKVVTWVDSCGNLGMIDKNVELTGGIFFNEADNLRVCNDLHHNYYHTNHLGDYLLAL
jgi:hypothetical protein